MDTCRYLTYPCSLVNVVMKGADFLHGEWISALK
jgi:hypothetical protein